ncbi:MAG: nuclear transport factor 2 family protein [Porticoccaceae bacterium]|nr:nuclear transport factor 2 family protein [Porticoccaceae bacterium]
MDKSNKDNQDQSNFSPGWGHKSGFLSLGSGAPIDSGDNLAIADRFLITERVARYCWAYDERQSQHLEDCFTPNAIWEGTVTGDVQIGPFVGRDTIIDWLTEFWPYQHDQRRHMVLNTVVEKQAKDSAQTLSYLLLMSADSNRVQLETTGFYHLSLAKMDSEWRISHFRAGFDYPFWPGKLSQLSEKGKKRHGISGQGSV